MAVMVITGASSGIGAALARAAVLGGYRVGLGARSVDRLAALADELGAERTFVCRCDVMDWDDQQALAAGTLERFGTLDVAVANAGIGSPSGFADGDPDRWRALVLTNVYGVALTVRAALPIMLRRNRGHIVLIGSTAGRVVLAGSLYSATKWAVAAIGEAVRQEVAGTQVRVSVVHPGFVDTEMFATTPQLSGEGPLRPDDIASAVLHVLSQPERLNVSDVVVRPTAQPVGPIDLR